MSTPSTPSPASRTSHRSPWTSRRVLAYAHQGGAWEAPSSTLYAIRRAVEVGATGIELDVHATTDGHLVVCHDGTVDRTTDASGAIAAMTIDEIERLDNAYWFIPGADVTPGRPDADYPFRGRAPRDRDFAVARLRDVLELLDAHPQVAINLDIKATAPAVEPYEERLAQLLGEFGNLDRVIVASFDDRATDAFSSFAPDVATSMGTMATAQFVRAVRAGQDPAPTRHVALQVPPAHGDVTVVDRDIVSAAHQVGLAVHVWTINDEETMGGLVDLGVDGIISDVPTRLAHVLGTRGVSYRP